MTIPLADRGNYYRGLLVLVRKDRAVDDREYEMMIRLGEVLDFDRRFCEAAIKDLLENKYIKDEPMRFSCKETAERFVMDALLLASADGEIHPKEVSWLVAVAAENGISEEWLRSRIKDSCEVLGSAVNAAH